MWDHSITMQTGRYRKQSFWNWGLFSSSAEVSGFLKYEFHIKGTVLCFCTSIRCIKCWIVIYCRGLKFPQKAMVLLLLEHLLHVPVWMVTAWKRAVFILEWCFRGRGDSVQDLGMYWLPEGCITMWHDKPTGCDGLIKKCCLGEQ